MRLQEVITGQSSSQVSNEQKIPGKCHPVKKVSLNLNNEIPAG